MLQLYDFQGQKPGRRGSDVTDQSHIKSHVTMQKGKAELLGNKERRKTDLQGICKTDHMT